MIKGKRFLWLTLLFVMLMTLSIYADTETIQFTASQSETAEQKTVKGSYFQATGFVDSTVMMVSSDPNYSVSISAINGEKISSVTLNGEFSDNAKVKPIVSSGTVSSVTESEVSITGVNASSLTISPVEKSYLPITSITITYTIPVKEVSLNETSLSLTEGDTSTLTATVAPTNATDTSVTWSSSDTSVATVDNGKVTAVAAGTATITVTTTDGSKTATCAVTVKAAETESQTEKQTEVTPQTEAQEKQTEVTPQTEAQEKITITKTPKLKKAKAEKGKVTVTWKKIKNTKKTKALLKQIKSIQVQYSTDPTFTTNVLSKNVGKKKSSVKLKLQRKTVYYIRMRYVGSDGYSNWSNVKTVKTK